MALIQSTAIPSGATDYELEQSLKFEDGRSTYLSKTFASAGNRRTWTWSAWIKRSNSSATHMLFFTAIAGDLTEDDHFGIRLDSGTSSNIVLTWGDGNTAVTNAIFRDPSAWMHIVVAIDTTQGTNTNRVKVYVNGTQQTFSSTDLPSQNFEYGINKAQEHNIASRVVYGASANYYDGYLAEVNFIDGQALTPSDFGETGTYNEWKPIEYSGTYGTNGFYLPFKQDYTVEGFSTVTYKGNGTYGHYIGGTGFKPDLTWVKMRSHADNHVLSDIVRGQSSVLYSNLTNAETTSGNFVTARNIDGFSVGTDPSVNYSSGNHVAWNWDMGADTPTGFGCVTYKGNGGTQSVSGYGFSPDLVWIKQRSNADSNVVFDAVRGVHKRLVTDATSAEADWTSVDKGLDVFSSDGFTVKDDSSGNYSVNKNSGTFVAWGWDMGNTTATNTSGTISSQVRANPTYGQSIVTYTGTGSNATIGHGLSSTPEVVIVKDRSNANSWQVFHTSLGNTAAAFLNLSAAADTGETSYWNNTSPTNSLVTLGTNTKVNHSGHTYVAYAFHSVSSYSKFGSYTGSGGSGNAQTLGFRPAFVMIKKTSGTDDWAIIDSTRSPLNPVDKALRGNATNAEDDLSSNYQIDFTDTGFTFNNYGYNDSGATYIYMAFAGGMDSISDYNTTGSIDSRVKANPTYGQSIVSYTGNATNGATVGHGLSSSPEMLLVKNRDNATNWFVYHTSAGASKYLLLDSTNAETTDTSIWQNTTPSSSVVTLGDAYQVNGSHNMIMYAFHSVTGYSKFGSYSGSGNASGNSVTLGFQPAFVMVKASSGSYSWAMFDNTRAPNSALFANVSNAEESLDYMDFTSTGFNLTTTHPNANASGQTYIYMAFADKREYAYWLDQSGNNNDWTSNNLTESDISVDSPTNNFATLNPLIPDAYTTLSEGNLKIVHGSSFGGQFASQIAESGKWYAEYLVTTVGLTKIGIASANRNLSAGDPQDWAEAFWYNQDGTQRDGSTDSSYGASYTNGDIIGIKLDQDNNTIDYSKNGVYQGSISLSGKGIGTNPTFIGTAGRDSTGVWNFGQDSSFASNKTAQGNQDGNDIGDFYYTPPTGFLALCTKNLPDVAVVPSEHFHTAIYTGVDGNQTLTGFPFQPDWTWIKSRSNVRKHYLVDAVRGYNKPLNSNLTSAEGTDASDADVSPTSDGLQLDGGSGNFNAENYTYVAWNWKANGSGSSNTNGSITSTVSANVDAGFSIISYTGTDAAATIGHGLSKKPELIIFKNRDNSQGASDWDTYVSSIGATKFISLNLNNAASTSVTRFNNTEPTATLIHLKNSYHTNYDNMIAYAFHSVDGYSKVGSYTSNASTDGAFVYTGFKPALILAKSSSLANTNWMLIDNARDTINPANKWLKANSSDAEFSPTNKGTGWDFTSNGFKIRNHNDDFNSPSGNTWIYIAFAETPFKYSNAK